MNAALRLIAEDQPDPTHELILRLARDLSIDGFCELVAERFNLGPTSGEQTIELRFENGEFRWAKLHSGRLGRDDITRMGESHA